MPSRDPLRGRVMAFNWPERSPEKIDLSRFSHLLFVKNDSILVFGNGVRMGSRIFARDCSNGMTRQGPDFKNFAKVNHKILVN